MTVSTATLFLPNLSGDASFEPQSDQHETETADITSRKPNKYEVLKATDELEDDSEFHKMVAAAGRFHTVSDDRSPAATNYPLKLSPPPRKPLDESWKADGQIPAILSVSPDHKPFTKSDTHFALSANAAMSDESLMALLNNDLTPVLPSCAQPNNSFRICSRFSRSYRINLNMQPSPSLSSPAERHSTTAGQTKSYASESSQSKMPTRKQTGMKDGCVSLKSRRVNARSA